MHDNDPSTLRTSIQLCCTGISHPASIVNLGLEIRGANRPARELLAQLQAVADAYVVPCQFCQRDFDHGPIGDLMATRDSGDGRKQNERVPYANSMADTASSATSN